MMFSAFRLIPALQLIFRKEFEFTEKSFVELNEKQYVAFRRDRGEPDERIYRVVQFEPTCLRDEDNSRIVLELTCVKETERQELLDAVGLIYFSTKFMDQSQPSFTDRLKYLRGKFPPMIAVDPE
jgi:hypothetical protein